VARRPEEDEREDAQVRAPQPGTVTKDVSRDEEEPRRHDEGEVQRFVRGPVLRRQDAGHASAASEVMMKEDARRPARAAMYERHVAASIGAVAEPVEPGVDERVLPGGHVLGKAADLQERLP
jgi:hypothetical protein